MTRAISFEYRASTYADVEWFCKTTQYAPSANFGGITAHRNGEIQAMAGFDHWTYTAVWVHFAAPNARAIVPLWRELLQYLASHGIRILIGVTPGDSLPINKLTEHLGWVEVYRQKDGWKPGVPLIFKEYRIDG